MSYSNSDDDLDDLLAEMDSALGNNSKTTTKTKVAAPTATTVAAKPAVSAPSSSTSGSGSQRPSFSGSAIPSKPAPAPTPAQPSSTATAKPAPAKRAPTSGADSDDDLDNLLNDIDSVVSSPPPQASNIPSFTASSTAAKSISSSLPTSSFHQCFPIYLSSLPSSGCPRLHCTGCDLGIVKLPNGRWDDSVEYLFFRNNTPNITKLKEKWHPITNSSASTSTSTSSSSCSAYCCQCSWINVEERQLNITKTKLKWICQGHQ